jgi:hypothetical protein
MICSGVPRNAPIAARCVDWLRTPRASQMQERHLEAARGASITASLSSSEGQSEDRAADGPATGAADAATAAVHVQLHELHLEEEDSDQLRSSELRCRALEQQVEARDSPRSVAAGPDSDAAVRLAALCPARLEASSRAVPERVHLRGMLCLSATTCAAPGALWRGKDAPGLDARGGADPGF